MVVDEPETDRRIVSIASDRPGLLFGFDGGFGLSSNEFAAKLWFPQLAEGRRNVLKSIREFVQPDDVCPILPFPSRSPRRADELIGHYREELGTTWEVDADDIVYADDKNPVDLYRTLLRIDDARSRVFRDLDGSLMVLSPLGSKVLAIGALMAALERGFPIVHTETMSYAVNISELDAGRSGPGDVVHVWLTGDAYLISKAPAGTT